MPITFIVKLDEQGRITIPKGVREAHNLKKGTLIRLTYEGYIPE
jgi:AbrB family looped-hinge helix DNA binding protein